MKFKPALSKMLHSFAFRTGASIGRAKKMGVGRILKFHGVGDDDYSKMEFESNLIFLMRHFSIVGIGEFVGTLADGKIPKNEIVLTFDDGLKNNLTIAYPILKRLKIPATFFVCPDLIENSQWLWTHEVRARLKFVGAEKLKDFCLLYHAPNNHDQFVNWMKTLCLKNRQGVEINLRKLSSDFQPTAEQHTKYDLMKWDELRSLDSALITIGSHTMTHPILPGLNASELAFEISISRKNLEEKLGRTIEYFCYPNGSHNPVVVEETRKNYRAAVSTDVGFVMPNSILHCLPRIGIAPKLPLLAWRLHRPTA